MSGPVAGRRRSARRSVGRGPWHWAVGTGCPRACVRLRQVTDDLTAVVGVSDDGGSSGRLRRELGVPPPGDLRMALAALCGDDAWGRTWSRVVQHRFEGSGELAGHALGNLLITALSQDRRPRGGSTGFAALLGAQVASCVATRASTWSPTVAASTPRDPDATTEVPRSGRRRHLRRHGRRGSDCSRTTPPPLRARPRVDHDR